MVIELFWSGELAAVNDQGVFREKVQGMLQQAGVDATPLGPMREGGCMMPLTVVALQLDLVHARALGDMIFERFGYPKDPSESDEEDPHGQGEAKGDCSQQ